MRAYGLAVVFAVLLAVFVPRGVGAEGISSISCTGGVNAPAAIDGDNSTYYELSGSIPSGQGCTLVVGAAEGDHLYVLYSSNALGVTGDLYDTYGQLTGTISAPPTGAVVRASLPLPYTLGGLPARVVLRPTVAGADYWRIYEIGVGLAGGAIPEQFSWRAVLDSLSDITGAEVVRFGLAAVLAMSLGGAFVVMVRGMFGHAESERVLADSGLERALNSVLTEDNGEQVGRVIGIATGLPMMGYAGRRAVRRLRVGRDD